jgi:UPF0271 protein
VYVLDTSAVLAGILSTGTSEDMYATPLVIAEVNKKLDKDTSSISLNFKNLYVQEPSLETIKKIIEKAETFGEIGNLSATDISVLALGLDLSQSNNVEIISDDYSIQNIASTLGLKYSSVTNKGIESIIKWEYYCKGCRKKFSTVTKNGICPICGSEIVRKPVEKFSNRKFGDQKSYEH